MVSPGSAATRPANSLHRMTADPKREAIDEVKRAQRDYERNIETAREARRKSFERAQKAGLSLREIGDAVGLHRGRIWEILRDK